MNLEEFRAEVARNGYTIPTLAAALGISKKKMYSHLAKENFTQAEISSMVKILNLDVNKIMIIFFADAVS